MVASQTANDIAQYLLWRVARERPEYPDYLTPLRLQVLLYLVQGWHLAELDLPAFDDAIEAWSEGPVAPGVWLHFSGPQPITELPSAPPTLAPASRTIVEDVWRRYKLLSAIALVAMASREGPWRRARSASPSGSAASPIPREDIQREFRSKLARSEHRLHAGAASIRAAARGNTDRSAPWLRQPPGAAGP